MYLPIISQWAVFVLTCSNLPGRKLFIGKLTRSQQKNAPLLWSPSSYWVVGEVSPYTRLGLMCLVPMNAGQKMCGGLNISWLAWQRHLVMYDTSLEGQSWKICSSSLYFDWLVFLRTDLSKPAGYFDVLKEQIQEIYLKQRIKIVEKKHTSAVRTTTNFWVYIAFRLNLLSFPYPLSISPDTF